uniref:G-protein coupled receptors family 1 profile domain-containing protein n=2 Tax=Amphimedon queenslandica TaxID=400682 RepID=A0A1X7TIR5_AMPQE
MDNINDNFTLSDVINGPLLAAMFGTEMIGGLITNSLVLILTASHLKTWKQPTTIFLSNMLLNNLVIGICIIPFAIITAAVGEWIFGRTEDEKETVCQVVRCIFTFSILTATESLVLYYSSLIEPGPWNLIFTIITAAVDHIIQGINKVDDENDGVAK